MSITSSPCRSGGAPLTDASPGTDRATASDGRLDVDADATPRMRVIGYLPNWYRSYADRATRIDFTRVTHVYLAFALGNDQGYLELAPAAEIDAFVAAAHAAGVKVFPSLCGGGGDGRLAPHYQPDRVDAFVEHILAFVDQHDLDGIDVDVEAPQRMGRAYDEFIARLRAAAPRGLPVTAAVAEWVQAGMPDDTLRSFDWIQRGRHHSRQDRARP